jgi:DNA-binding CsgD family transcriptional regulator/N-acetylneuraminic acid mutarotase
MSEETESLSEREIEILKLVATGVSNKEIAAALQISPNTVKVHMRNIFAKIGVVSRTEATLYALKNSIVASVQTTAAPTAIADEVIYTSSPLAIADAPVPIQLPPAKRSFPLWAIVLTLSAVLLILLLTTALITARRPPAPTAVQTAVQRTIPRWYQAEPLPTARYAACSVTFGGKLYVIGGRQDDTTFSNLLRYDPSTPGWSELTAKPTAVSETQAVVIQEKIYIPGGRLANGLPTDQLEVYDIQTNTWDNRHAMPRALMGSAIAVVEGSLYVFGGWDGKTHTRSLYIYSYETDQWTQGTDLPSSRSYMAAAVVEGHIQLIGGETKDGPIADYLIYYPGRDVSGGIPYETGLPLPQPRSKASSVVMANITYLFGGVDGNQQYLPPIAWIQDQDTWTDLDGAAAVNLEFTSVLAAGNYIHIIGGLNGSTVTATHEVYQAIYTITMPLSNN